MFILERKMKIMLRTSWPRATADVQEIMVATSGILQSMELQCLSKVKQNLMYLFVSKLMSFNTDHFALQKCIGNIFTLISFDLCKNIIIIAITILIENQKNEIYV